MAIESDSKDAAWQRFVDTHQSAHAWTVANAFDAGYEAGAAEARREAIEECAAKVTLWSQYYREPNRILPQTAVLEAAEDLRSLLTSEAAK